MDKREVERLIPIALEIVKNNKNVDEKTRNKLSGFGASLVMSGLLPAIAGYSKSEKKIVVELIGELCKKEGIIDNNSKLLEAIDAKIKSGMSKDELKDKLINYTIAFKLVLDACISK